ncbi:MAG: leucine-rich repeat domain-containing protein [Bacteroidales bacterium]|nr:leucine-rich repeat domain-containing protein [Bacteroidales bacterium]
MRKFILIIALLISGVGLNAQNVGDNTIIDYEGYSLQFTITSVEPAECEVKCSTPPTTETAITIPSSVEIGGMECSVTKVGNYAFSHCSNLTSIEIPNSVTSIGDSAFSYCHSLTNIEIPNSVSSIGTFAFFGCTNLTSIEIPNSVTSIGNSAFSVCSELTSIEIPNSVTSIGNYAFSGCTNLTSIEIPNSVTSIGYGAFANCSALETMSVEEGNSVYDSRENCNAIIKTETNTLVSGCKSSIIPNSVTSIGIAAFSGCSELTSIEIPNSVTSIGNSAFYGCSELTSIEIPNSVTSIGDSAFSECYSLTSIICHAENVPETESSAFNDCPSDMIIYVPVNSVALYEATEPWNNYNIVAIPEIGDNTIIDYEGYSLQFTITSVEPAECEVRFSTHPTTGTAITIPSSVEIGGMECSVTKVGHLAFSYCNQLTSIEIPNSVTSIGDQAFYSCTNLTSIEIPNSVSSIGNYAFSGCHALETMSVEEGNSVYDSRENCNAIIETETNTLVSGCKSSIIPNSVTSIGISAFSNCSMLTSIEIPNSVTSIGNNAFDGCSELTSIEIPNSVSSIGNYAFSRCTNLTSIEIPNSVTSIGYGAFSNCSALETMSVEEGNSVYDSRENCNAIIKTETNTLVSGCKSSIIPNSVTSIGEEAFYYCNSLTSIEIPNSVTSIGNYAFSDCSGLTSIEIPNSVTSIGDMAFSYCYNLTSIRCHAEDVPETDANTFLYCQSSMNIQVPENSVDLYKVTSPWYNYNITKIYPFQNGDNTIIDYGDYSLLFIIINVEPAECKVTCFTQPTEQTAITIPSSVEINEMEISVTSIGYEAFYNCDYLTSIEIPNSVTSIGYRAFYDCDYLTSIEIPNSVTSIGEQAFYYCNSLTSIEIPNSVTSIGDSAFSGCTNLTSIEIPNSVTSIGNSAFSYCYKLTSIEIPNSVTSIGNRVFFSCYNLETMTVDESNTVYDSRENCNAIIETETNTLISGCMNSFIPNGVTSIGDNAFSRCYNLTSIEIPNSVTSIGITAFSNCYSLTNIEIPNSVTSIGNAAFDGCYSLTNIECHASEVPETGDNVFYNCPSDMTIMVPSVALEDYQAAEPWNNYNLITGLEFEVDVLKNIEEAGTISGTGTYTDGETVTLTAVPNEGYKFVYWSHNGTVLSADAEYSFTVTSDMVIKANFLTPNHWTADPTIYPNNMTIIADVKIDGRDLLQKNIIFKLYDSYGDGWNGCSLTVEFSDGTPSQNLTFDSGSSAVHTLKVYSGTSIINVSFNQGLWPHECSFTIEYEDGELIYQSSGTPNAGHVCEFKTLGYSPLNIELGAFCGEELRGTSRSQYIESPVDGFEFFLLLYGNDSDEITFKLYDHETDSVLDLVTQERIDFEANSSIGIMSNPNIINFTSRVSVTTEAEIAEAGTVTGGGMYHIGETITLTATSNEGFVFKNWTLNDEVVSEESEYTFVVASEAEYKANYHYRQEKQLTKGWNWYSTYVNNEGPEGLYAMEDELGSVGRQIKSQNDFVSYEDGSWYGTLSEVSNDEMYMIKLSRAKKFEMIGEKVDLSECPITLGTNWKWISYPLKRPMNVGMAFSGITPNTGDYIKSQTGFAQYDEELGWRGTLNSMIPGEGYMYYNTSGYAKTLVYPEANAKTEIEDNITSDYNHWIADMTMYPANMNIIATVDNNSDNNFEVAAFCEGECRGSARPIYIEELNANIIFLTVCGDNNETISFRYYDIDSEKEYDIVNTLTFGINDITGNMREPYIMSFIPADVDEVSLNGINIYPNPADINDEINLGAECERIEIYNSLGVKVSEYENINHIDGIETAGIYVIKIINKSTIKYDRIIVR